MTQREPIRPPLDDRLLDRLVDGELTGPQRRELLASLDGVPDGWRRCALAFLEAQCWREEIGGFVAGSDMQETPATRPAVKVETFADHEFALTWPQRGFRLRPLANVAAGLLLAFLLGLAVGLVSARPQLARAPLAQSSNSGRAQGDADVSRSQGPAGPDPAQTPDSSPRGTAIAMVNLGGSATPAGVPVPILAGPGFDEQWLRSQPSALPKHVQREWERQGYQVEQRRRLVSVALQGGPRVSIPVDEVKLHFVGQHAY